MSLAVDEPEDGPIGAGLGRRMVCEARCSGNSLGLASCCLPSPAIGHLCPGTETRPNAWGTFSFLL